MRHIGIADEHHHCDCWRSPSANHLGDGVDEDEDGSTFRRTT